MSRVEPRTLDFPLAREGLLSRAARAGGHDRFVSVTDAIRRLPDGRARNPQQLLAVLDEQRGTCSAKHRFLAAPAHERGHPEVALMVGLYEMSGENAPGIGPVLRAEGLAAVLEAHCYLKREDDRFDYSGLPAGAASPPDALIEDRAVSPLDLPAQKIAYHRAALARWARARAIDPARAWTIREGYVATLGRPVGR